MTSKINRPVSIGFSKISLPHSLSQNLTKYKRIGIVGTTNSYKSTIARQISTELTKARFEEGILLGNGALNYTRSLPSTEFESIVLEAEQPSYLFDRANVDMVGEHGHLIRTYINHDPIQLDSYMVTDPLAIRKAQFREKVEEDNDIVIYIKSLERIQADKDTLTMYGEVGRLTHIVKCEIEGKPAEVHITEDFIDFSSDLYAPKELQASDLIYDLYHSMHPNPKMVLSELKDRILETFDKEDGHGFETFVWGTSVKSKEAEFDYSERHGFKNMRRQFDKAHFTTTMSFIVVKRGNDVKVITTRNRNGWCGCTYHINRLGLDMINQYI